MFTKMRRINSAMSKEDTMNLLLECREGVLGTIGTNGYPHSVPVNYVLYKDKIYLHSAKEGLKIQNIMANPKVSFTIFDNITIVENQFTTNYQSVMVYGKAKIIEGNIEVLMEFIRKYSKNFLNEGKKYVGKSFDTTHLIQITIEHMTGKERSKT